MPIDVRSRYKLYTNSTQIQLLPSPERKASQLYAHDYCGGEPALPAFSTDAHPLKSVGAVPCFSNFRMDLNMSLVFIDLPEKF